MPKFTEMDVLAMRMLIYMVLLFSDNKEIWYSPSVAGKDQRQVKPLNDLSVNESLFLKDITNKTKHV